MIEVSHLNKSYGSRPAVQDLSFMVPDGQIYGLLGPNGAGKSTIMNILTGYLAPTEGEVKVAGFRLPEQAQQAKACVGYLPEQPPLYPEMTVQEYLDFVAELKGVKHAQRKQQVLAAARRTGLEEVLPRVIRSLSKGYRQRVGIAQALLGSPQLIILDEPTVGLDPAQVIEIRNLIRELGKAHTVILSSHILSEVQAVCQQVLILSKGRLVAVGSPEELGETLNPGSRLRATAQGETETVLATVRSVPGICRVELESAADGQVTFTAESEDAADRRAAVSGVAALLLAYMMPSLRTMFTTGSAVALALFTAIAAVLSVVAGLRSKSFTLGCLSFAGCCVALTALFLLKSSWLTEAFSAVLSALCLFTPFEEFVNSSFSIPTLVYYLTVAAVFLFFTAQGLEKRRWN